jgi:hypothetical protein
MMMMEKRREKRLPEENKVTIEYHAEALNKLDIDPITALTKDISLSGARLECGHPFPVGSMVKIRISLSKSHKMLNLDGRIKWVRDIEDDELFEMGVEFEHTLPNKLMVLLQHLFGK